MQEKRKRNEKQIREVILLNRQFQDLNPLFFGYEICKKGYKYGPAIRKYTLIHYVVEGKGTFQKYGKKYTVNAGQAFLILPEEITTYVADEQEPWHYQWIAFDGALSKKFEELPPVFSFPSWVMSEILEQEDQPLREYHIASVLFRMYALLFDGKNARNHYVRRVRDHIRALYMQPLRVERIAEELNLDRRYLSRLFKQKTGQTIQEYLISVRMEEAKQCLSNGFSVEESAHLCGYDDASNFSKMFKRYYGISPQYWKGKNNIKHP